MPNFNLTAAPSAGDTVTDAGWTYEFNGTSWHSQGYTDLHDPLSGFTGPLLPAITDPTSISASWPDSYTNSPWWFGRSGTTNVWNTSDTDSLGAWVVIDSINTSDAVATRFIALIFNETVSTTFVNVPDNASASFPLARVTAFDVFSTGGAYDSTNSVVTTGSTNKKFGNYIEAGRNLSGNPNTMCAGLNLTSSNVPAIGDRATADQVTFTVSNPTGTPFITAAAGKSYDIRRGNLISTGYWPNTSTLTAGSTTDIPGTNRFKAEVYELYHSEVT